MNGTDNNQSQLDSSEMFSEDLANEETARILEQKLEKVEYGALNRLAHILIDIAKNTNWPDATEPIHNSN